MYGVTIVTKDGQQIESIDLADKFSAWEDAAGDDVDKYNALVDVNNKYTLFDLSPGAKGTALLAFDEPVTFAWRVTVMPAEGSTWSTPAPVSKPATTARYWVGDESSRHPPVGRDARVRRQRRQHH